MKWPASAAALALVVSALIAATCSGTDGADFAARPAGSGMHDIRRVVVQRIEHSSIIGDYILHSPAPLAFDGRSRDCGRSVRLLAAAGLVSMRHPANKAPDKLAQYFSHIALYGCAARNVQVLFGRSNLSVA